MPKIQTVHHTTNLEEGETDFFNEDGSITEVVPTENVPAVAKALVTSRGVFSGVDDMDLKQLSFDELVESYGLDDSSEVMGQRQYGPILDKNTKARLIGVPLIVVKWDFQEKGFVSACILTQQGERYILNDGGTGIADQLREYTKETGRNAMLLVKNGLTVSKYDHPEYGPSETYYLDTKVRA